MTQDRMTALVTGANSGLGKQLAKDLVSHGYLVFFGARDLSKGQKAADEIGAGAVAIQIDVTDPASIAQAADRIDAEAGRLDLLVNNAAIVQSGRHASADEAVTASAPSVASLDEVRAVFETNFLGAIAVTQAMLPLIRKSTAGRIVNVSSGVGSLTLNSDPDFPWRPYYGVTYSASKTALNALTVALAIELEDDGIKVRSASPSPSSTAINGFEGSDSVEVGVRPVLRAALDLDSPTGNFTGPDGPYPW